MPRTSNKPKRPELPTSLLSELSSSSSSLDSRRSPYARPNAGKGGKPPVSRKEARKQQRTEKKQRMATHRARMHEKPAPAPTVSKASKDATTSPVAPGGNRPNAREKQQGQQQKLVVTGKRQKQKPQLPPTTSKQPELTDQEKMLKLAKKDPALLASLRSQGLIPSTAGMSDGEMGRDETIDRMDIARYEKLLKLNKRKRKNKKKQAADGEQVEEEASKPASVPKSIAHDGLGDLFAMVGGVTSKGEVSVVANPTVHVESDGEQDEEAEDHDEGGGDGMLADMMGDGSDLDSDVDSGGVSDGEFVDEDHLVDSEEGESGLESSGIDDDDDDDDGDDDEDDKYLAGLGLDDLEGMLGGEEVSDDNQSSSDGEMEMDSDLEAEIREILARPEYAAGGLDSFGEDDSDSESDGEDFEEQDDDRDSDDE